MPTDHPSDPHLSRPPLRVDHDALVARHAAGDVDALSQLYDQEVGRAYAVAWSILGTVSGAEDAVTDGTLDFARRCVSTRPATVPAAWWLCRVSEHAMADRRAGHGAPGHLSGLTETQGQVLALACAGRLSRAEIAAGLELSPAVVARTMSDALFAIRASRPAGPGTAAADGARRGPDEPPTGRTARA